MASVNLSPLMRHLVRPTYLILQLPVSRLPSFLPTLELPETLHREVLPQFLVPLVIRNFSNLSSFFSEIWDSILRAVPKKKTPYSKKRSRQLAGKNLGDVTHLNHCSGCGRIKRMHILCPHCVQNIKDMWAGRLTQASNDQKDVSDSIRHKKQNASSGVEMTAKKK